MIQTINFSREKFKQFEELGFLFFKAKGKRNPSKEDLNTSFLGYSQADNWVKEQPGNTLKMVIPKDILVYDFDCHGGPNSLSVEQINCIEKFCNRNSIPHERTPNGLHVFVQGISNSPKIKQTRICSLGCKLEIFPEGSFINFYNLDSIQVNDLPGSASRLPISYSNRNKNVMSVVQQGDRHNTILEGLRYYGTCVLLHSLFNELWSQPPLDPSELASISEWVLANPLPSNKEEKLKVEVEVLMNQWIEDYGDMYSYDPWEETWSKRDNPCYPVYKKSPIEVLKKDIFYWGQSKGYFLHVQIIKNLIHQLQLVLQVKERSEVGLYLCFQNGIYELETMTFHRYNSDYCKGIVSLNKIPLDYLPGTSTEIPPVWLDFFERSFNSEALGNIKPEDMMTLIVAHLLRKVKLQAIYIILGPPRTGKSVISNVICTLFGEEVLSTTTDAMSSNPRFFTQQLVGKKLVLLPDARMEYILDSTMDLLKRITGGDLLSTEIKGSIIGQTIKGDFPVLITSQSDLSWVNDSGVLRRIIPIRMGNTIPLDEVIVGLEENLIKNSLWLVERALILSQKQANSLVKDLQQRSLADKVEDPIGILITQHLEFNSVLHETNQNLYARFEVICKDIGVRTLSKNRFLTDLIQQVGLRLGVHVERKKILNSRGISGLRLKEVNLLETPITSEVIEVIDEVPITSEVIEVIDEVPITSEVVEVIDETFVYKKHNQSLLINEIHLHQKLIASQIKQVLSGYRSKYSLGKMHIEALGLEKLLDLWVEMFKVLSLCDEILPPGDIFSDLYGPYQDLHYKSGGERFKWFKSKRMKTRIYPHKLYIPDKFYPRAYEVQDVVLDDKGKKIGSNTPNVSMMKDLRNTWYSKTTEFLFSEKAYAVDLSAAHLCLFVTLMQDQDLADCVKAEEMWGTVMEYLPERFRKKPLLKKLLYSGLNGGSYRTYSNGWEVFNYPLGDKDPQFQQDLLDWELVSAKVPLFSQLRQFNDVAIELYKKNNLYTPLLTTPVEIPIEIKNGNPVDLSYKAGCRILGSGEFILIQGLALDLIDQGCILLAPEHDGLVVVREGGLKESAISYPTLEKLGKGVFDWDFKISITELEEQFSDN